MLNRRHALLGWVVWKLARRRLRKKLSPDGTSGGRPLLRGVVAVAALAALAAVWAKRSGSRPDSSGDASA